MKEDGRPQTGKEALQWAAFLLRGCGFSRELAWQESTLLLAKACGRDKLQVLTNPDVSLNGDEWEKYEGLVRRRSQWEPLQYILGEQEFMGLPFKVNPAVLIPRCDTETLAEEGIRLMRDVRKPLLLDVGTGSGAIALSLAHYLPQALVLATDISAAALEVARDNARRLGLSSRVRFYQGDLLAPLPAGNLFDLIVSNPPYIAEEEMRGLPRDVQKEPFAALYGGEDGLSYYRRLIPAARTCLKTAGWLLLEIGWRQGGAVKKLLAENGYDGLQILQDLSGHDRVAVGQKR